MSQSLWDLTGPHAASVMVPGPIQHLLEALVVQPGVVLDANGSATGTVGPGADTTLGGFASLDLDPGAPPLEFVLSVPAPGGDGTGFRADITLTGAASALRLADSALGVLLRGAQVASSGGGADLREWLEPAPSPQVHLVGVDVVLRIDGDNSRPAAQRIVPKAGNVDDVINLQIEPKAFFFGGTGFGLELGAGIIIDDSELQAPPAVLGPGGAVVAHSSDVPAWKGLAIRGARLFFPKDLPIIGGHAVSVDLELGSPAGIDASARANLNPGGPFSDLTVRVEWHDPLATSLGQCLPTLIEATATLTLGGTNTPTTGSGDSTVGTVVLGGGQPLVVRARFARDPAVASSDLQMEVSIEALGEDGLVAVHAQPGEPAAKVFVTAAALATALVADSRFHETAPSGDASGNALHLLLTAAVGLSAFVSDEVGSVVIHAARLAGRFHSPGTVLALHVDYSVDVVVKTFTLGALSVGMSGSAPMRVRYRDVRLEVDMSRSGLEKFNVSFSEASMDVEDPGRWIVDSPGSLLDVLGTRSGRGSVWFEVDLAFAIDLGPVKVEGATVRIALDPSGDPQATLRGLTVRLDIPGVVSGRGFLRLTQDGFDAALDLALVPLNFAATGGVSYEHTPAGNKIVIAIAVDLPGPIPLAQTGLGIFGLGGLFGINAQAAPALPGQDEIAYQLAWIDQVPPPTTFENGEMMFGFSLTIGTVPDLGFSMHATGGLVLSVPDLAIRIAVNVRLMGGAAGNYKGLVLIDNTGALIALRGDYDIDPLLSLVVPIAARFPTNDNNWYIHIGSDGQPDRPPGPIRADILKPIFDLSAEAYLMIRGAGISNLGGDPSMTFQGFAVGMGFAFHELLGGGIIRLDLTARAAVGIGTHPLMVKGKGELDGSLRLGPVSIGAHADVDLELGPGDHLRAYFEVCGSVDLFFFEISACISITIGDEADSVPPLSDWPLPTLVLCDRKYRSLIPAPLASGSTDEPLVWPDAVAVLSFPVGPAPSVGGGSFVPGINHPTAAQSGVIGGDQLSYLLSLPKLDVFEVDAGGHETLVTDPFDGTWQLPPYGDATAAPSNLTGARELALFTGETMLWARRLVDGGEGSPSDPVTRLTGACAIRVTASEGWALGGLGKRDFGGWRVPPEPTAFSPLNSVVEATVGATWSDIPITSLTGYGIPAPATADTGGLEPAALTSKELARSFPGALRLPGLLLPMLGDPLQGPGQPFEETFVTATLDLDEPQLKASLWLMVPDGKEGTVSAAADSGPCDRDDAELIDGMRLLGFAATSDPTGIFTVRYPPGVRVLLLGVRGYSQAAIDTATTLNAASDSADQGRKAAAATPVEKRDHLLKPGTRYRLRGTLASHGVRKGVAPLDETRDFSFAFRTAPAGPVGIVDGKRNYLALLLHDQDTFDPVQIQRYLLGYEPADHTVDWFLGDAPAANFESAHVVALAAAYSHDLAVSVRRTDTPPGRPDQTAPIAPIFSALLPAGLELAPRVDERLVQLMNADCPTPAPGLTASVFPNLEPRATYDLAVVLPPTAGAVADPPRLPGISFRTSRYNGPEEQFGALGLLPGGQMSGDAPLMPTGVLDAPAPTDRASTTLLDRSLRTLGLAGWPWSTEPRSTLLWTNASGAWQLVGVLLESPEALHRPGRCEIVGVSIGNAPLEFMQAGSSWTRFLFATGTPISIPAGGASLTFSYTDHPVDPPAAVAPPTVISVAIGALPSFAGGY